MAQAFGAGLLLLLAFAHPLLAFPLFVDVLLLVRTGHMGRSRAWSVLLTYGVFYALKLVAFRTPYDTVSFGKATAVFDNIGQTPAWHWFASALSGPVWGPWLLLLVVLVAWMGFGFAPRPATGFPAEGGAGVRRRHRDPKLVLMVSMLSAGWIWLVLGSQADAPDYYLQNLLLPLVLVVGLPTVVLLEASPSTKPMRLALLGTALLLPLKGVQLGALAASYATHLEWVGALAAERKTHPERPSKRFVQEAELP